MKSPFPGMDPYLERHWGDVHARLAVYTSDYLRPQMPSELAVRIEEYVTKLAERAEPGEKAHRYVPDVRVVERGARLASPAAGVTVAEATEPLILTVPDDPQTLREVRIIDQSTGGRLVTAIELISPANKIGSIARRKYRRKRLDYLRGRASVVEIDFLRSGRPITFAPPSLLPANFHSPYSVCVRRGWRRNEVEVYPASFRERLPVIRVPLRKTDPDAKLDLQALIDACYEAGSYGDIDYTAEPDPPLTPGDAAWTDAWLRQQQRR